MVKSKMKTKYIGIALAILAISAVASYYLTFVSKERGNVAGWYSSSWSYRRALTIDGSKVAGPLTNFPVLFSVTDPVLRTTTNGGHVSKSDGSDILFTAGDGVTKLDHEIERYVASTGELVAWVKMPQLVNTAVNTFHIYYGNSTATNQANPSGVWGGTYRSVWHMKDNPGATAPQLRDSTANANNGSAFGGMGSSDLIVGKIGQSIDFDGTDDYFNVGNGSSIQGVNSNSSWTISAWVKLPNVASPNYLLYKEGDWAVDVGGTGSGIVRFQQRAGSFPKVYTSSGVISQNNTWYYLVLSGSGNSSTVKTYVNGTSAAMTGTSFTWSGSTNSLLVGRNNADSIYGVLDEVRVAGGVLSDQWIRTEYTNQNAPANFYGIGQEQILVTPLVNNASCVSITAPSSVNTGTTFTASVVMNNNGTKPWTADADPHGLGSQNPTDNVRWGTGRIALPSSPINPGSNATFTIYATAPTTAGTYAFDWKMVEDLVEWFGTTCTKSITVVAPTTGPTVSITSPSNGATVSGTVTISANASSSAGVQKVNFYYASTLINAAFSSPYSVSWNTTGVPNGVYTLTAKVYDNAAATATSKVDVTVSNGTTGDTTKPTVSLTAPASGSTVSGTVTISANASDNVGVSKVEFYRGTTLVGTDTVSPYSVSWSTTSVTNGSYSLTAKAYDAAGNSATSAAATVTVSNSTADTTAPSVSLSSPSSGSTVSGTITVSANASDNVGVSKVDFYNGSSLIGSDASSPYSISWNTANVSNGTYTLTAKAYDAAGNSSTSSGISVNVNNQTTPPPTGGGSLPPVTGRSIYVAASGSGTTCSSSAPCTLDTGLGQANPGDEVVLKDGVYNQSLILKRNGNSSNYITVRAQNKNQAIIRRTSGIIARIWASYVVVHDLYFDGEKGAGSGGGVAIGNGDGEVVPFSSQLTNIYIDGNIIEEMAYACIKFSGYGGKNVTISNNKIGSCGHKDYWGEGVYIGKYSAPLTGQTGYPVQSDIMIKNNVFDGFTENAIEAKPNTARVTITGNTIRNQKLPSDYGVTTGSGNDGTIALSGNSHTVYNNVFYSNKGDLGAISILGNAGHKVYNNVFYNYVMPLDDLIRMINWGNQWPSGQYPASQVFNNTFYNMPVYKVGGLNTSMLQIRNNIGVNVSNNLDSSLLRSSDFRGTSSGDFHLNSSSPAINKVSGSPYSSVDFDGRSANGARDYGAFEY